MNQGEFKKRIEKIFLNEFGDDIPPAMAAMKKYNIMVEGEYPTQFKHDVYSLGELLRAAPALMAILTSHNSLDGAEGPYHRLLQVLFEMFEPRPAGEFWTAPEMYGRMAIVEEGAALKTFEFQIAKRTIALRIILKGTSKNP